MSQEREGGVPHCLTRVVFGPRTWMRKLGWRENYVPWGDTKKEMLNFSMWVVGKIMKIWDINSGGFWSYIPLLVVGKTKLGQQVGIGAFVLHYKTGICIAQWKKRHFTRAAHSCCNRCLVRQYKSLPSSPHYGSVGDSILLWIVEWKGTQPPWT